MRCSTRPARSRRMPPGNAMSPASAPPRAGRRSCRRPCRRNCATIRSRASSGCRAWRAGAPGACLADDMGLGKTVQAIAVMLDRAEEGPCLVVAPTSVVPELGGGDRPLRADAAHLSAARGGRPCRLIAGLGPRDVLVCSYGLLHQAAEDAGGTVLADGGAGRGAGDQERRHQAGAGGPGAAGRLPPGADRHAGGELPRRTLEPVQLRQSRPAGFARRLPEAVCRADRARPRSACAPGAARLDPALPAAPDQGGRAQRAAAAHRTDDECRDERSRSAPSTRRCGSGRWRRIAALDAPAGHSERSRSWRRSPGCGGPAATPL